MSDRSSRCRLCGRLAARLDDGFCSPRCCSVAAGYTSPTHPPAALAAPTTAVEARVVVHGELPSPLPVGCVEIARLRDRRRVVRVAADDWHQLRAALGEMQGAGPANAVEIFTLQTFTVGGLTTSDHPSPDERAFK
jgi:hypothetical protein